jgi:hypothetical protein
MLNFQVFPEPTAASRSAAAPAQADLRFPGMEHWAKSKRGSSRVQAAARVDAGLGVDTAELALQRQAQLWEGVVFGVTPELPPGLALNRVTGTISGHVPLAPAPETSYTVRAQRWLPPSSLTLLRDESASAVLVSSVSRVEGDTGAEELSGDWREEACGKVERSDGGWMLIDEADFCFGLSFAHPP